MADKSFVFVILSQLAYEKQMALNLQECNSQFDFTNGNCMLAISCIFVCHYKRQL